MEGRKKGRRKEKDGTSEKISIYAISYGKDKIESVICFAT